MPPLRALPRYLLAAIMVGIGVAHFPLDDFFVSIMPPALPAPRFLVHLSGVIEIGLGLGLCVERSRRISAWGLMLLYLAVYPANIYMALENPVLQGLPEGFPPPSREATLWRLPAQLIFWGWAWIYTRPEPPERSWVPWLFPALMVLHAGIGALLP